jgi:hypothetical protein
MHAITDFLYGKMYNENEISPEWFNKLRDELNDSKYFQSYREEYGGCAVLNQTFIYKPSVLTFKDGDGGSKLDFYQENNVKHWASE